MFLCILCCSSSFRLIFHKTLKIIQFKLHKYNDQKINFSSYLFYIVLQLRRKIYDIFCIFKIIDRIKIIILVVIRIENYVWFLIILHSNQNYSNNIDNNLINVTKILINTFQIFKHSADHTYTIIIYI